MIRLCSSAIRQCRLQCELHRKKSRSVLFPTVRCSTGRSLPSNGPDICSLAFPHRQERVGNPAKVINRNVKNELRGTKIGRVIFVAFNNYLEPLIGSTFVACSKYDCIKFLLSSIRKLNIGSINVHYFRDNLSIPKQLK